MHAEDGLYAGEEEGEAGEGNGRSAFEKPKLLHGQ